jgi:hypothetical protein
MFSDIGRTLVYTGVLRLHANGGMLLERDAAVFLAYAGVQSMVCATQIRT